MPARSTSGNSVSAKSRANFFHSICHQFRLHRRYPARCGRRNGSPQHFVDHGGRLGLFRFGLLRKRNPNTELGFFRRKWASVYTVLQHRPLLADAWIAADWLLRTTDSSRHFAGHSFWRRKSWAASGLGQTASESPKACRLSLLPHRQMAHRMECPSKTVLTTRTC